MTLKVKWEKTGFSINLRKNKDGYGVYNPSTQEDYQEFQTSLGYLVISRSVWTTVRKRLSQKY